VQGFPLRPQQRAAGPIKRPESLRPLAHCGMRGCRSGEVRSAGKSGVRAGQTQPTISEGKGHLLNCGALLSCQAHDGESGVHHFEFRPQDGSTNVLPLGAPRQVCHPELKAAVEQDPAILVQQG
jgi:hypothetical protein